MREIEKVFFLPKIKKNVSLKKYTTFLIGGQARYFFEARSKEDIKKAILRSWQFRLPFFVLGGGSNLLVEDKGFNGLVIKNECRSYDIKKNRLYAESGVLVADLVRETGKLGLSGLEWAGGLPGTLGGAIRGNAGAFAGEISDIVISVEAIDKKGKLKKFSKAECRFSYRSSIFKRRNLIVLSALLKLKKGEKHKIQAEAKDHIKYRRERHPLEYGNAGSVFKNCDLKKIPNKVRDKFLAVTKNDPFPVVPTAYIISEAGLKGLRVGRAEVSKKHPNYIVNLGGAKAKDVFGLIKKIKKIVKKKFAIVLEEEIEHLGFSTLDNNA